MYKNNRFIAAGDNEFYRYGKKAAELLKSHKNLVKGYYSLPVDGGSNYTLGTSIGKYGEYMVFHGNVFPVNKAGYAYVKAGSKKEGAFLAMIDDMISDMEKKNQERVAEQGRESL